MNNITNFNMTFKQNFLTREACFSWDKMTDAYYDIYYDIFVNDNFLFRIQENKICLNLGVGCEEKCVKARPVFKTLENIDVFHFVIVRGRWLDFFSKKSKKFLT